MLGMRRSLGGYRAVEGIVPSVVVCGGDCERREVVLVLYSDSTCVDRGSRPTPLSRGTTGSAHRIDSGEVWAVSTIQRVFFDRTTIEVTIPSFPSTPLVAAFIRTSRVLSKIRRCTRQRPS